VILSDTTSHCHNEWDLVTASLTKTSETNPLYRYVVSPHNRRRQPPRRCRQLPAVRTTSYCFQSDLNSWLSGTMYWARLEDVLEYNPTLFINRAQGSLHEKGSYGPHRVEMIQQTVRSRCSPVEIYLARNLHQREHYFKGCCTSSDDPVVAPVIEDTSKTTTFINVLPHSYGEGVTDSMVDYGFAAVRLHNNQSCPHIDNLRVDFGRIFKLVVDSYNDPSCNKVHDMKRDGYTTSSQKANNPPGTNGYRVSFGMAGQSWEPRQYPGQKCPPRQVVYNRKIFEKHDKEGNVRKDIGKLVDVTCKIMDELLWSLTHPQAAQETLPSPIHHPPVTTQEQGPSPNISTSFRYVRLHSM
jgi:hypothetical protein